MKSWRKASSDSRVTQGMESRLSMPVPVAGLERDTLIQGAGGLERDTLVHGGGGEGYKGVFRL
jgi:hypothetical protein